MDVYSWTTTLGWCDVRLATPGVLKIEHPPQLHYSDQSHSVDVDVPSSPARRVWVRAARMVA